MTVYSPLSKLASGASVILIGTIFARGLGLLAETLIARTLPPALYGNVALAYTLAMALGSLSLLGVHEGTTKLLSSSVFSSDNVIKSGYLLPTTLGLAVASTFVLFPSQISTLINSPGIETYLPFFAPYILLYPLMRISVGVLRAFGLSTAVTISRNFFARITSVLILLTLFAFGVGTSAAIAYWTLVPFLGLVGCIYYIHANDRISIVDFSPPSLMTVKELWSFSWPLAASSFVFLFLSNIDVIMIGYFRTSSDVGYYRSIQPLRQVATFVMTSLSFMFLPIASQYYEQGQIDELGKTFTYTAKWIVITTLPPV